MTHEAVGAAPRPFVCSLAFLSGRRSAGKLNTLSGPVEDADQLLALMSLPEAVWELSLGLYLVIKGFTSVPILNDTHPSGGASVASTTA